MTCPGVEDGVATGGSLFGRSAAGKGAGFDATVGRSVVVRVVTVADAGGAGLVSGNGNGVTPLSAAATACLAASERRPISPLELGFSTCITSVELLTDATGGTTA